MAIKIIFALCFVLMLLQTRPGYGENMEENEIDNDNPQSQHVDYNRVRYGRQTETELCENKIPKMPSDIWTTEVTTPESWIDASIEATNVYRRAHGVPDLVKNEKLCKISQYYSNKLAKTDQWEHSKYGCGENLYTGYRSNKYTELLPVNIAIDGWYAEIKDYDFKTCGPKDKKPSTMVGHFTQLVWKDSKETCIAFATNAAKTKIYVTAEYSPPGNFIDEYSQNVSPNPNMKDEPEAKAGDNDNIGQQLSPSKWVILLLFGFIVGDLLKPTPHYTPLHPHSSSTLL